MKALLKPYYEVLATDGRLDVGVEDLEVEKHGVSDELVLAGGSSVTAAARYLVREPTARGSCRGFLVVFTSLMLYLSYIDPRARIRRGRRARDSQRPLPFLP